MPHSDIRAGSTQVSGVYSDRADGHRGHGLGRQGARGRLVWLERRKAGSAPRGHVKDVGLILTLKAINGGLRAG